MCTYTYKSTLKAGSSNNKIEEGDKETNAIAEIVRVITTESLDAFFPVDKNGNLGKLPTKPF